MVQEVRQYETVACSYVSQYRYSFWRLFYIAFYSQLILNQMENIFLNLSVKMNGYFGDYKTAIDEAYILAKQLNIGCSLNYANQYLFKILPTMTQDDIDKLKETKIVIAV